MRSDAAFLFVAWSLDSRRPGSIYADDGTESPVLIGHFAMHLLAADAVEAHNAVLSMRSVAPSGSGGREASAERRTVEQIAHEILVERGVLHVRLDDLADGDPGALQLVREQLDRLSELIDELGSIGEGA